MDTGIDTNIEVIVVSLTIWEAHHSPRAKPEGCGDASQVVNDTTMTEIEVSISILSWHDETKLMMNKQILSI